MNKRVRTIVLDLQTRESSLKTRNQKKKKVSNNNNSNLIVPKWMLQESLVVGKVIKAAYPLKPRLLFPGELVFPVPSAPMISETDNKPHEHIHIYTSTGLKYISRKIRAGRQTEREN